MAKMLTRVDPATLSQSWTIEISDQEMFHVMMQLTEEERAFINKLQMTNKIPEATLILAAILKKIEILEKVHNATAN